VDRSAGRVRFIASTSKFYDRIRSDESQDAPANWEFLRIPRVGPSCRLRPWRLGVARGSNAVACYKFVVVRELCPPRSTRSQLGSLLRLTAQRTCALTSRCSRSRRASRYSWVVPFRKRAGPAELRALDALATNRTEVFRLIGADAIAFAVGLFALLLLDWLWVMKDYKEPAGELIVLFLAFFAFAVANWVGLPIRNRVAHALAAIGAGAVMTVLATLPALAIMYEFHFIIGGSE